MKFYLDDDTNKLRTNDGMIVGFLYDNGTVELFDDRVTVRVKGHKSKGIFGSIQKNAKSYRKYPCTGRCYTCGNTNCYKYKKPL